MKSKLLTYSALTALTLGVGVASTPQSADAGGFYIREHGDFSTAFAGDAARAANAGTVWSNPAGLTELSKGEIYAGGSILIPYAKLTNNGSTGASTITTNSGGNPYRAALLPAVFASYQIHPQFSVGLGITVPFGLTSEYNENWFGVSDSIRSSLKTVNISPVVAYKPHKMVSIGGGLDIMYADAELASQRALTTKTTLKGHDWAVGGNVGIHIRPNDKLKLGVTFRSGMTQKLKGSAETVLIATGALIGAQLPSVTADLKLPNIVTAGFQYDCSPKWSVLGQAEWFNWSRFNEIRVVDTTGATADSVTPQNYKNSFSVSLGTEHRPNEKAAFRGGLMFDKTPTQDGFRTTGVPDQDRFWVTLGAGYKFTENFSVDAAYAHIFVKNADINVTRTLPAPGGAQNVRATAKGHADIIGLWAKVKL